MEEIKTNFDKIMAQLNESVSHVAPKKLSFDSFSDSTDSMPKRQKRSLDKSGSDLMKSYNESLENTLNSCELNVSVPPSPWETRRAKADLVEAQARIAKFKQEIDKLHKVRAEIETHYESKVRELTKQCDFSSNKVLDLEKHLTVVRKREHAAKSELNKVKSQFAQQKQVYEEKIHSLQMTNAEIEENASIWQNRISNELSESRRQLRQLEMEYQLVADELQNTRSSLDTYRTKANAHDELQITLEKVNLELSESQSRVKELEYEISAYGDWKDLSKASQSRLANLPDLEREVQRLKDDNKNLHDSLGNKLLLEEQVYDLKSRFEKYENAKMEAVELKVQVKALEDELKEWKKVAQDHCLPNSHISAISLRARIEDILQKDIVLTSDYGTNKVDKHSFETQIHDLKKQIEMQTKTNSELKDALQRHKNIMIRVQKKLMLVAKERDCYKQLVENFEKDLTISNTLAEVSNADVQLRARVEMLEKTLNGYKEMCENLEKEVRTLRQMPDITTEGSLNPESYEHLKQEIETLRLENDRLRRRKEELELEMEHRCLKGDFNIGQFKVVHLANNPAAEAYENSRNELEKLQAEVERLKRRNRKLEEEQEEMTSRLNETANMTVNIKEMNVLRAKIESLESKIQHMKEVYKSASLEFREVCYMLFGYKIDRVGNTNYRISSMYAESENEYLNFRLNESGVLDMLETDYSISLGEMMRTHLATHKSLPMFLCALTMDLFNRTTVVG